MASSDPLGLRRFGWKQRFLWERPLQHGTVPPENRGSIARVFTYLYGLGGLLLLGTLFLPHAEDWSPLPLIGVAVVAELVALGYLLAFDRVPLTISKLAPTFGTILIFVLLFWGGQGTSSAYSLYFFWVVLSAAYFFDNRIAVANVAVSVAAYALVLSLHPGAPLPLLHIAMLTGALLVAGTLTVRLHKQAEFAEGRTAAGERQTRQIIETAYDAFVSIDAEGRVTGWNTQAEATFGWMRDEVLGRSLAETVIPERYREAHRQGLRRFAQTGKGSKLAQRLEMTALRRDGQEFPVEFTISVLWNGCDHSFHAFLRDVTQRNHAERELRESEERFRLLIDNVTDYAIFMLDPEGNIATWNRGAERLSGYASEEIIGRHVSELYLPEDTQNGEPAAALARAAREGHVEHQGWRVRKDGTPFWTGASLTALRGEDGELRGFSKITRDLTERRLADLYEQTLHAATRVLAESGTLEEALPALLEATGHSLGWEVGDFWMAAEGSAPSELESVAFWHSLAEAPIEFKAETMRIPLRIGEGLTGGVWASAEPRWIQDVAVDEEFLRRDAALASGLHAAISIPVKSGRQVLAVMEFFSEEIRQPDPALLEMLHGLSHQIGQFIHRKQAEAEADRIKAEFFALVSHELRTPLTSIVGYLELLGEDPSERRSTEQRQEFLGIIDRNSQRLLRLVGDLLFVAQVESGKVEFERGPVKLSEVACESVDTFRARAASEGLELRSEIEDVGVSLGDGGRIGQALDNLVANAVKFTPGGGTVTLRLHPEGQTQAVMEVADTGVGIPKSEQGQLFERFFRADAAKAQSIEGTGLGLSIVETIVSGHGGKVSFESEEGVGTTFRITLPLERPVNSSIHSGARSRRRPVSSGTGAA
jgi:PAS domain S-box-containing protein